MPERLPTVVLTGHLTKVIDRHVFAGTPIHITLFADVDLTPEAEVLFVRLTTAEMALRLLHLNECIRFIMPSVYGLCDPITFEMRYVGQTRRDLEIRLREHIKHSIVGRTHRDSWIRSLGIPPMIVELERVTLPELDATEIKWVKQLKESGHRLTNHTDGGRVQNYDDDVRRRISVSVSRYRTGKKHSPETIEKIRRANSDGRCIPKHRQRRLQID